MKKAILISIQPYWVENILNGEKTIEIRKSMPKCDLPIDVYIYVTKSKPYLQIYPFNIRKNIYRLSDDNFNSLNGKVVAKFTLNKVEWVACEDLGYRKIFFTETREDFSYVANMTDDQLSAYFSNKQLKNGNVVGYAWHIDNLQIFDESMELNQFEKYYDEPDDLKPCCNGKHCIHKIYDWCENQICCEIDYDGTDCPYLKVNKAPQSWQYVYVVE